MIFYGHVFLTVIEGISTQHMGTLLCYVTSYVVISIPSPGYNNVQVTGHFVNNCSIVMLHF